MLMSANIQMFFKQWNEVQVYLRMKLNCHSVNDSYIPRKSKNSTV